MNSNSISINHSAGRETASIRSIHTITSVAVLAAISFALTFFEFPVPLSPSFAKMDISDFPALVGAMTLGPWAGVAVEIVKNLLGLFSTSTGGIGELANFLMGSSLSFTAGLVFYKWRGQGMAGVSARFGGYGSSGGTVQLFHFAAVV